jgi:DNA polymerase-3 subunit beta
VKFQVGRDALGEAVAWVARALPARPVLPMLSGMLIEAAEPEGDAGRGGASPEASALAGPGPAAGALTVSCFDYDVSARLRIEADVAEPGRALVPGRLLAEIIRSLQGAVAEFTSDAESVGLTCGSAEFTLVSLPAEDYPALPEPPDAVGTIDSEALATAAMQVIPAASRDDTLPALTAVCLDIDGERLTLAATDRYRLAVRETSWQPARPGLRSAALVPARTLGEVARTMARGAPVSIAFAPSAPAAGDGSGIRPAEGVISFECGGRRLTVRLIGGEFIRYRSRFPAEFGSRAELPAGAFLDALRRVSLVAERAVPVSLAFGDGAAVVEARTEGRARAVETVPASFAGDQRVISFSPHYLMDGVAAAACETAGRPRPGTGHGQNLPAGSGGGDGGADAEADGPEQSGNCPASADPGGRIRLDFTSPARPAMITWADPDQPEGSEAASSFRYLLVPLRGQARE